MGLQHADDPPPRSERVTCGRCEFCDLLPWAMLGVLIALILVCIGVYAVYTIYRTYVEEANRVRCLLRIEELKCATERIRAFNNTVPQPQVQHSPYEAVSDPDGAASP